MMVNNQARVGSEVDHLLTQYTMILRAERGLAANTLDGYRRDLGKFKQYCTEKSLQDPKALTTQAVLGFLEFLREQIIFCLENICDPMGVRFKVTWTDYFPATENNLTCNALLKQAAIDSGLEIVEKMTPFKFGEDFGWFSRKYPTAMFGLGAGNIPPLHNPAYDFPDEIISGGVQAFQAITMKLLDSKYK